MESIKIILIIIILLINIKKRIRCNQTMAINESGEQLDQLTEMQVGTGELSP